MDNVAKRSGRSRLVSALLAAGLAVASLRSFRKGKRGRGLLAGVGAVALGFSAAKSAEKSDETYEIGESGDETGVGETTETTESTEETDAETTTAQATATSGLTCAACGEPITTGQRRGPNEEDAIVHDDCA